MKKTLLLLLFCSALISCSKAKSWKETQQYPESIKGDWLMEPIDNNGYHNHITFSFEDSLTSYPFSFGQLSGYQLSSDNLTVKHYETGHRKSLNDSLYHFKILKLDNDKLELLPLTERTLRVFQKMAFPYS